MQSEKLLDPRHKLFDRIVFFPVRHHSPAASYFVKQFIEAEKPDCILIEGPSDYNDNIADLILDHNFPIAIYSYRRSKEKVSGIFYPFCEHSPEYVAVKCGLAAGAAVEFIDLPYSSKTYSASALLNDRDFGELEEVQEEVANFYKQFSVNNFNSLWDKLIESDDNLTLATYLERAHGICLNLRHSQPQDPETTAREAFMAKMIRSKLPTTTGQILVLTGGFHSAGLYELLLDDEIVEAAETASVFADEDQMTVEFGCTLTPFSDKRLDAYHGYGAGLPCPGFYRQAFEDRCRGTLKNTHRTLLASAVESLRKKKQLISTADVIVAEQMARGLAGLRQHAVVFREDLIDGIASSVVKDEFRFEESHPLVDSLRDIFRGSRNGKLSSRVALPPLTEAILLLIAQQDLTPQLLSREITCDLEIETERTKSTILHRLVMLGISGFKRKTFTGFGGNEKGRVVETWLIVENVNFHSDCVEAAAWGGTVEEAASNKLKERVKQKGASASSVAAALLDASLMALAQLSRDLFEQMQAAVAADCDFLSVSKALASLLELYYYHNILSGPERDMRLLLVENFDRALWLLEYQGSGATGDFINGIGIIVDVFELLGGILALDKNFVQEALVRSLAQPECSAIAGGAISGALWKMGEEEKAQITTGLLRFSLPEVIGDFVVGLLSIAGDVVHSEKELLHSIDTVLRGFDDDQFLHAAPSLRLAFSRYSPREKVLLLRTVVSSFKNSPTTDNLDLEGDVNQIARVMALESKVIAVMHTHKLRPNDG